MKKSEIRMIRQGDVMLTLVDEIPKEAKARTITNYVVAEGEATGHAHCLLGDAIIAEHGEDVYMKLSDPSKITHQEHDEVHLSPGIWKVTRQREYTPEEIRRVAD